MGSRKILMPDVGEGITEAEITEWHVKVGDPVREDDPLAAVMTDKATVEIPSPVDGKVTEIAGEIGEMTAVGSVIVTLETDTKPQESGRKTEASVGSGPFRETNEIVAEKGAPQTSFVETSVPALGQKPLAAPAVRRRAMDNNIDLVAVPGTGPGGRISHRDLDAWLKTSQPPRSHVAGMADTRVEEIKIAGLRRRIAERMQDATRRIAHITYVEEVDVTELEDLRARLNAARAEDTPKLTLLPFLIAATTQALKTHPKLNAHFDDEAGILRRYDEVHLGMATQTPSGLMVPVIANAEARGLANLAREIARLAEAAKSGGIKREELTGSTITLSSLGPLGGIVSTPIINSPEVAIIGVNKIAIRQVWHNGDFVPRKVMNLSSSFDHRIVDGWEAASFIQEIKRLVEDPIILFI